MKKLFFIYSLLFIGVCTCMQAQNDLGVSAGCGKGGTATTILKNWEAIGINPSNLGWSENKTFSLGVFNSIGLNIQSQALDLGNLYNSIAHPKNDLSSSDKLALSDFFTTDNGLNIQTHVNWFAASTQLAKIGGIAVNIRDRFYAHAHFNPNLADVLFNGFDAQSYIDTVTPNLLISNFTNGTQVRFTHYRELNFAYGRKIISIAGIDLYGGIGYKRVWGLGYLDVDVTGDVLKGQSALSTRYNLNGVDSSFNIQDVDKLFNNVGNGNAFDFGINAMIKNMFKFGIAFTDLGSIKWTDNVMTAKDTLMPVLDSSLTGMQSYEISDAMQILFGDKGLIRFKPSTSFSTAMPARMRLGAGIKFRKILELAADIVIPLNTAVGNLQHTYYALGGEVNIVGTFKLHTGICTSKDFGYAIPLGVGFGTGGIIEFSISTSDVLTWIGQSSHPNAGLILGVFRFNLL